MSRTGADVVIGALTACGARHVFGMPGSHSTAIYDAIVRSGSLSTTLCRNEQSGAFMADGYARVSAQPGLVCTTAGPGATNALTGVAEAWADSVPLLLISGQVNAPDLDRECGNYHEIDLEGMFRPITRWCGTVRRPEQIPNMVGQAFEAMTFGRPRPAALFLPQDLMRQPCDVDETTIAFSGKPQQSPPEAALDAAAQRLAEARGPLILAGGGALWSGAAVELETLAKLLNAPVITTLNGKGILDERSAASLGHARSARARAALPHADAMLAVGCRFTEVLTDWRRMPVPSTLIQVDIDPGQIGVNYPVTVGIVGDASAVLSGLIRHLETKNVNSQWGEVLDRARNATHPRPEWIIDVLRAELPETTPVFTDACEIGYRMQSDWPSYGPRRFFYPSNYITLGWAFPAAIGGAVALGGPPVVSVSGDGGFVMTAQELATVSRYKLPVIAIVHNDSTYGAIKNIQQRVHGQRYLDVDLNNPCFLDLAAAYGVPARRASSPDELREAVRFALRSTGPFLIEVPDRWRYLRDLSVPVPSPGTSS